MYLKIRVFLRVCLSECVQYVSQATTNRWRRHPQAVEAWQYAIFLTWPVYPRTHNLKRIPPTPFTVKMRRNVQPLALSSQCPDPEQRTFPRKIGEVTLPRFLHDLMTGFSNNIQVFGLMFIASVDVSAVWSFHFLCLFYSFMFFFSFWGDWNLSLLTSSCSVPCICLWFIHIAFILWKYVFSLISSHLFICLLIHPCYICTSVCVYGCMNAPVKMHTFICLFIYLHKLARLFTLVCIWIQKLQISFECIFFPSLCVYPNSFIHI